MPDAETQSLYDELNRRGVFSSDADAQAIGHELRRRGVVSDATQGGLVKPAPPQASTSKPFSPTSGNTLPPPSQADLQKQFASSKTSNAPITMQTLPMLGKPSGKSTPMMSPEATAAFNKQYQDQLAGNAFYTGSQLNALPNDFTGWLKRTLSGMVTPENMLIGAALPMAPALGPLGVAAEKAAGVYFGAQGVAQGIKVGQKYGVGAGLGAALPFIAPAALGKAGEIINKRGLPAPPEAQPTTPIQPARPIVPTEPGTARPPFVGTPTPETAAPTSEFQPTHTIDDVPVVKVAGTKKTTYVDEQSKPVVPTKAKPAIPLPVAETPLQNGVKNQAPQPVPIMQPEATAAAPVNMAPPAVEPPVTPETPAVPNPAPTAETLPVEVSKTPALDAYNAAQDAVSEQVQVIRNSKGKEFDQAGMQRELKSRQQAASLAFNDAVAESKALKGESTNVQSTGLQPVSEVKPGSETNIVAPEQAATAAGKPVEGEGASAQRASAGQPSEPKINAEVPSGETKSTGIAQRVHDTRKPGEILPGQGASPEEMINRGRTLIKDGADPEAHLQMMEKRGSAVSGDDMSILRAEHERLSKITDAASDASRARPLDAKLKAADKSAYQDETDWAKRIKPYQTEWSNIGKAQQGETDVNTGSFSGIRRVFEDKDHANRPMTKSEETQAAAHADKVKGLETKVSDLQSKLDTAMKQTAETKTAVRTGTNKSNKITLPSDPAELRKALAEMRAKGGLFNSGKGIIEVKPGAKTGAVNFGSKPQFIPEVARAIWNHAKENYIDKTVLIDFDDMVNGVASDLGLTHDEVKSAFSQNKNVRDITDQMYRVMSSRRDAINQAKRFIDDSNKSGFSKAYQTVTNLPRGIAVFGHGSVGMVTHAGANMFRPSSWSSYWPNVLNQFKYWAKSGIHEEAMRRIESNDNYTMWDRSGLKIDPNKAFDDYQKYGKFIGNIGRAGNRGMDALKSFRMEYANKIWEGLPENLKQQKDMPKLIADWVNHATGVGSIGHGQIVSAVHEGTFAATLEASRWARLIGDPVKTAKTFANWKNATPAEQAIAKFRVQRAAELTAVMAGALAANNGLLVATNQKDRINMLHPTQSDWLRFKWDGKTFDPTGNLAAPVKFLAQLLAEANPNRTPAIWEHGEKRSELMTQTMGQYIRGKLAPQYGIAADVATGADAIGRPLPWAKEPGKPSAPKYTPTEYTLKHAPLPFAGAAEAVYEAMREKGANDAEARGWVDKLTKYGGTFAKTLGTEMTGIRVGKPSKPFIPASKGSGVSYKSPKF